MKNSLEELNRTFELAEEIMSDIEDGSVEIFQFKKEKEKNMNL